MKLIIIKSPWICQIKHKRSDEENVTFFYGFVYEKLTF